MKHSESGWRTPAIRFALCLVTSLVLHGAFLYLTESASPQPPNEPVRAVVEIGLVTFPPQVAAPPVVPVPVPQQASLVSSPKRAISTRAALPEADLAALVNEQTRKNPVTIKEQTSRQVPLPTPSARDDQEREIIIEPTSPSRPATAPPAESNQEKPQREVVGTSETSTESDQDPIPANTRIIEDSGRSEHQAPLVEASPRYDLNTPPAYPRRARLRGWEGVVLLRVTVASDGRPENVMVENSSGYSILDDAAVGAVRGWRFEPAQRGNLPVVSDVIVPLRFELRR